MYHKLLVILAFIILFAGCVDKSEVELGSYMKIINTNGVNLDNLNGDEVALYDYSKLSSNIPSQEGGAFTINKYILVYPIEYKVLMNGVLKGDESVAYLNASESYLSRLEKECSVDWNQCTNATTCKTACNSLDCKYAKNNDIGTIIYDFANLIKEKKNLTNDLKNSIGNSTEVSGPLAQKIIRLMVVDTVLKVHPAITKLKLCPRDLAIETINGNFEIETTKYKGIASYSLTGSGLRYPVGMQLEENIPSDLIGRITLKEIPQSATYETQPSVKLKFNEMILNGSQTEFLVYNFDSEMPNDRLSYLALNNAKLTLTITTPPSKEVQLALSIINIVYTPINSIIGMPRLAIAICAIVGVIALLTIIQIIESLVSAILAIGKRVEIKTALIESLGIATPIWMQLLAVGIVLLFVGIYIESGDRAASVIAIDENNIYEIVPITDVIALIGIAIYFFSAYLIGDVIIDRIKSLIGGRYYSRNMIQYSPTELEEGMKTLKQKVAEAFAELDKYADKGIDMNKEYDKIATISMDELRTLYKKGELKEAGKLLEEYFKIVNEGINSVKTKQRTADLNYEKWVAMVKKELEDSKNEKINIAALIEIPREWRLWVIRKFIEERKDEGWLIEDTVLKRTEMSESERSEALIKSFIKDGTAESGAIFRGNIYSGGVFKSGKLSVNTALFNRIIKFILTIGPIIERTKQTVFVSYGKKNLIYVISNNGVNIVLITSKMLTDNKIEDLLKKASKTLGK